MVTPKTPAWEYVPQAPNDLTDSETKLAKILAAVEERWTGRDSDEGDLLDRIEGLLVDYEYRESDGLRDVLSAKGRALLDRARKAGVL